MFKKHDARLQHLNDELLAEEEDWLEEEEEESGEDFEADFDEDFEEDLDLEEIDELLNGDDEDEEFPVYGNQPSSYRRGSPKMFDYALEDDMEDEEFLYKDDFKKANKKKSRKHKGLLILAILELLAITALALWWASWML